MGLIDGLQNGNYNYKPNGTGNISITTGDGNNNISVSSGNIDINTGNGNQNIKAIATNDLVINTGLSGDDIINATAFSAEINTFNSDDKIQFTGTTFDISALDGNKTVIATGDLDDTQHNNSIDLGNGDLNQVRFHGNNVDMTNGDGNLQLGFVGDNVDLTAGNGNHDIGFWGNDVSMNLGNGNNSIQTLDFALAQGNFNDFGAAEILEAQTEVSSRVISDTVQKTEFEVKEAIADAYNLDAQQRNILNKIDLNAKYSDGKPLYAIAESVRRPGTYVVVKRDGARHSWSISDHECIAFNPKYTTVAGLASETREVKTEYTYFLNGVSNVDITSGDGNNNIFLTNDVNGSDINIDLGNAPDENNIYIRNGFTVKDVETETIHNEKNKSGSILTNSGKTWTSPLVVDYNKDGKVSAKAGMGVDVDGDGVKDGAAIGGDKMLAMTDFSGNGAIDGQEVFGDQTVSPFTKKPLNAANGFEALKLIAEEAQQYTGTNCMKNGEVDLEALNKALASVGVKVGFISDFNNKEIEDLGHVASINVAEYEEADADGAVQHRQLGSYTDKDGNTYKTNDVWFESQTKESEMDIIDILKKVD